MSLINEVYMKFFTRTNEQKIRYLIKNGAKIGENTRILSDVKFFAPEPYLIEIGENCLISVNVTCMTHDGGISVLKNMGYFENKLMDKLGRVKIGNNVFIGKDVNIMPGVTIGDNVIIGLGSIVTKDVESGSVVCGVPAKKIKSIEEYGKTIQEKLYPTGNLNKDEKRKWCEDHNV